MNGEVLSLQTAEKLQKLENIKKYIKEMLNNPLCDERQVLKNILKMLGD